MDFAHQELKINGVRLHVVTAGPQQGEPVILLHGFPDAWFGWDGQIRALAAAGYRVIAPDQRGYNTSDKPKGRQHYQLEILADDIVGLAEALNCRRFNLVGHDFGAMVSWRLAMLYPERLLHLVIANVPHPAVMANFLHTNPDQMRRSWYAFYFQLPWLPEILIRASNYRMLSLVMSKSLSAEQLSQYRRAWAQPGAMTCMLNWYRALVWRLLFKESSDEKISVSTMVLWGKQDPHLSYKMAQPSVEMCTRGHLVTFADAAHWVHQDKPQEVNQRLLAFLTERDDRG